MAENILTYRRSRDGNWAVFGPASMMGEGRTVTVTKADGTTRKETIVHVSREFDVDGVPFAYGYLARSNSNSQGQGQRQKCDNCGEWGGIYPRRDSSGLPGLVCGFCNNDADYELSFG
jgi:hypothetical protein